MKMKTKTKSAKRKTKVLAPKLIKLKPGERGLHSAANILDDVMLRFESLAKAASERRVKLEAWAAEQPKFQTCHHGQEHQLNLDDSSRASHGLDHFVLVYKPCTMCVQQRDVDNKESWLHKAGVPKILLSATVDNWTPTLASDFTIKRAVKEFIKQPRGFLVFTGSNGNGKTHLAVGIMRELRRGTLMTQDGFLMALRRSYRDDYAVDIIQKCKDAKLLVLDEMGVSGGGRDEFPALYDVLNYRYGEDVPTIITTNVPLMEFKSAFGDRIADRLVSSAVWCEFKGKSQRGRTPK